MLDIIEQQEKKKFRFVSFQLIVYNMRREERNLAIIIELIVSSVISQLPEILIIYVPVPRLFLMMLKKRESNNRYVYYLSNKTQINGLKQQKRLIKQQQQQIKSNNGSIKLIVS